MKYVEVEKDHNNKDNLKSKIIWGGREVFKGRSYILHICQFKEVDILISGAMFQQSCSNIIVQFCVEVSKS